MKKWMLNTVLLVVFSGGVQAQGIGSFFQQKKTQKQYLLQQIAALKIYIAYAQKGYSIAKDGLQTIGGFTGGEWKVHDDYFIALGKVNPEIKKDPKVAAILSLQWKTLENSNKTWQYVNGNEMFSADEQAYIRSVLDRLLEEGVATLEDLQAVTTDGKLQLKDDERIARINRLYFHMQEQLIFSKKLDADTRLLAASRRREQKNIRNNRVLQGIKNTKR